MLSYFKDKILLTLTILPLLFFSAYSTSVNLIGNITQETLGPDTVFVHGNIFLPRNSKCQILPSTQFFFKGFFGFTVEGKLIANGTRGAEIVFSADSNTSWEGITLNSCSDSTQISNAMLSNASCAIHVSASNPWIHNNKIFKNRVGIECWNSSKPLITNNDFLNNEDAINNYKSNPHIFNNVFAFNKKWGVWGVGADSSVYSNNNFYSNGAGSRASFINNQFNLMPVLTIWSELEQDPLYTSDAKIFISQNSPLILAGLQEFSNNNNWNITLPSKPAIGNAYVMDFAKKGNIKPLEFVNGLGQNLPNPFNPVTKIKYQVGSTNGLSVKVPVDLSIFNIKGQLVKKLISDKFLPGKYEVIWDSKDQNNNIVSSGTYYYKLTMPGFVSVSRMMLSK